MGAGGAAGGGAAPEPLTRSPASVPCGLLEAASHGRAPQQPASQPGTPPPAQLDTSATHPPGTMSGLVMRSAYTLPWNTWAVASSEQEAKSG